MKATIRYAFALFVAMSCLGNGRADDWPGFRGANATGVSPDKGTPVKWSGTDNIAWKAKLPGPGSSSPIVVADKVFVTCFTGTPSDKLTRHLLCLDRANGTKLWQKDVPAKLPETPYKGYINEHGYASSTPVSDGKHVYVFFGKSGVFAFDLKGNPLWHKDVGGKADKWGSAASPVLYKDLLIVNANMESGSVVALDKKTGNEVWRKPSGYSWCTPVLVDAPGGKKELVLSLPNVIRGLDPQTGDPLWTCKGIQIFYITPSPVAHGGVVYVTGGVGKKGSTGLAIRAGGRGDVTNTHVLWSKGISSNVASPLVAGNYLFALDNGKLACFSADKGQLVTARKIPYRGKEEYTSPTVAGDKVYWVSRAGITTVFSADDKMQPLGENRIDEDEPRFDGSPVVSDGQLLLRSTHYLYCVGKK